MDASRQPGTFDAVLGSSTISPADVGVLGGLEGIQQRFTSGDTQQKVRAVWEAHRHGEAGLPLIVQALHDPEVPVQKAAYCLLRERSDVRALEALESYSPYPLFECLSRLEGHRAGVTAVAIGVQHFLYRPDRPIVISADRDGILNVWDLEAREVLYSLDAESFVYAISIDAGEDRFLIKAENQEIKAWSLRGGEPMAPPDQRTRVNASVTTFDQRYLILGSGRSLKIWDLSVGREICQLEGHSRLVTAVAVSDDRQTIVSGSEDRTIGIWGVA